MQIIMVKATRFQVTSLIWALLLLCVTLKHVASSSKSSSRQITKMRRLDQRSSGYGSVWSLPPKHDARRLKGSKDKKKGKGKGKGDGGDGSVVEPEYDSEDSTRTTPPTDSLDTRTDDYYNIDDPDNIFDPPVIESESEFLVYCREQLTSASVTDDGLVSQEEFAEFLEFVCDVMHDEKIPQFGCPTPDFEDLSTKVQLTFAYFICGGTDDLITCLNDFVSSGEDFGFDTTFPEKVEGDVLGVCCALFPFLVETNIDPLSVDICPDPPVLPDVDTVAPTPSAGATTTVPTPAPVPTITPMNGGPTLAPTPNTGIIIITPAPTLPRTLATIAPSDFNENGITVNANGDDDGLGAGVIAGIAVGALACCLLAGFIATRRAKGED